MSDTSIKGPGDEKFRPRETQGPTIPSKIPPRAQEPSVSRLKDEGRRMGELPKEPVITPGSPSLPRPTYFIQTPQEAEEIHDRLEEQFISEPSYNVIEEAFTKEHAVLNQLIQNASKEIFDACRSNRGFEYSFMLVQNTLSQVMHGSLKSSCELAKFYSNKQAEVSKEARVQREKQKELEEKQRTASLITNIFAAIGDFFNMVAAAATFVVAAFSTAATAGAGAVALAGAVLWLTGAVMGFAAHVNGCLPEEKRSTLMESTGYKAAQGVLTVLGMIMTLGASAYGAAGQASAKAALEGTAVALDGATQVSTATINFTAKGLVAAATEIGTTNTPAISTTLLDAAGKAATATDALIEAIEAGNVTVKLVADAHKAAQTLQNAMAGANLPVHFVGQATTAFNNATNVLSTFATAMPELAQIAQIEANIVQITAVKSVLQTYQAGSGLYAASTEISTKIMSEVYRQESASAEAQKAQQDSLISLYQFISNVITETMDNTLQAVTDFEKDTSSYVRSSSQLGQNIASKI